MKFRKLTLASAVVAAIGVNGLASAGVTGLPGEGLLMPLALGPDGVSGAFAQTYVTLSVPGTIGQDTMINFFTAPNSTAPLTTTEQDPVDPRIRWTLFNHLSQRVSDGYCDISPNDVTVWTNDNNLLALQRLQDRAMQGLGMDGIPSNLCGAAVTLPFGYVVFQTVEGALGRDADFAMAGDGGFAFFNGSILDGVFGVPVLPMADGADASLTQAPALTNEIIAKSYTTVLEPREYAPIFAGNRMNDALAPLNQNEVIVQMPIQGPAGANRYGLGASLHAFWFDRTAAGAGRLVTVDMYDDQEQPCSFTLYMPQEIEVFMPNTGFTTGTAKRNPGWDNLSSADSGIGFGSPGVLGTIVDVTDSVLAGGNPTEMCEPAYWQPESDVGNVAYPGAIAGMLSYNFIEEGETDGNFVSGSVNSASVAFHAQQFNAAWTTHMGTARGIMD